MKGSDTTFSDLFQATQRFVIPIFQRNYDWRKENCQQLYNDLIKVVRSNRKSHFFGSFVVVRNPNSTIHEYTVVDGQQRLTTTTLLLLAMYNLINRGIITPSNENLKDRILDRYLVNLSPYIQQKQPINQCAKLRPIKQDQEAFYKLFGEDCDYIANSNLTENYNYFYKQIQIEKTPVEDIFSAIEQLGIINIILGSEDNPQLVFESLNSTGLALSESDKIRNYLLMNLEPAQQDDYYINYWKKIEDKTKQSLDMFIRDYLSIKTSTQPSEENIYFAFKNYKESKELQAKDLLFDLQKYANFYSVLLGDSTITVDNPNTKTKTDISHITACICRLNHLRQKVVRPFFLEVLHLYDEGQLSLKDVYDIFRFTENYIFRRQICKSSASQGWNKMFVGLHNEIIRLDGTSKQYLEKYKYTLLTKRKNIHQFPTDDDFGKEFVSKKIYSDMKSWYVVYILERLENFGTDETRPVYQRIEDQVYTVEHIMPQSLRSEWIKDLGAEYQQIYNDWLHRIANLTLALREYNSKYQNKRFIEKRDCKNGFRDSGFRMNHHIAQCNNWGLKELQERSIELAEKALEIWERPQTNYCPQKEKFGIYTLENNPDLLSGKKIKKFVYKEIPYPVKKWHEMYKSVLEQLYSENRKILYRLAQKKGEEGDYSKYFSIDPNEFQNNFDINHEIYCQRTTDTPKKLRILRYLLEQYGIDLKELEIHIKIEDKNKE